MNTKHLLALTIIFVCLQISGLLCGSTAVAAEPGQKIWEFQIGGQADSSPVVSGGFVYVGSHKNKLFCLNAETGAKVWEFKTEEGITSTPTVSGGFVYFGCLDSKVYCLNGANGAEAWEYKTGGKIISSPVISGDFVYVGSADNNLYCLDIATGKKVWSFTTGGEIYSSPAVSGGNVYVNSNDKKSYCLDAKTGAKNWEFAAGSIFAFAPVVTNGFVYLACGNRCIYSLNAKTGAKVWGFLLKDTIGRSPAVSDGFVYVGSYDYNFYCLDAAKGKEVWKFNCKPCTGGASPSIAEGKLYVGSQSGKVYCLDAATGKVVWEFLMGGYIFSAPAIADGRVYVTGSGKICCLATTPTKHKDWPMLCGNPERTGVYAPPPDPKDVRIPKVTFVAADIFKCDPYNSDSGYMDAINKIKKMIYEGEREPAAFHCKTHMKKYPKSAVLPYWLGRVYFENGLYEHAAEVFQLSAKLDENRTILSQSAYSRLAETLWRGKKPQEAEATADLALKASPEEPRAMAVKSLAMMKAKKEKEAVALCKKAWEINPNLSIVQMANEATSAVAKPEAMETADLFEKQQESVVVIKTPQGSGSGFIINQNGFVLTNLHVVRGAQFIQVIVKHNGKEITYSGNTASLFAIDEIHDIAVVVIRQNDIKWKPFVLANSVRTGEKVIAIGNPGMGNKILEKSASEGIVSSIDRAIDTGKYVQTTAPVNPGNSGGPLLNAKGEVVGMVTLKAMLDGVAFAIPAESLRKMIDQCTF